MKIMLKMVSLGFFVVLALSACGGGGGSSTASDPKGSASWGSEPETSVDSNNAKELVELVRTKFNNIAYDNNLSFSKKFAKTTTTKLNASILGKTSGKVDIVGEQNRTTNDNAVYPTSSNYNVKYTLENYIDEESGDEISLNGVVTEKLSETETESSSFSGTQTFEGNLSLKISSGVYNFSFKRENKYEYIDSFEELEVVTYTVNGVKY